MSAPATEALNFLRTNSKGVGWRNASTWKMAPDQGDNVSNYRGIMTRRNYAVKCSDNMVPKQNRELLYLESWKTYKGASAYLVAMRGTRSVDTRVTGALINLLKTWCLRLVRTFIRINYYNKMNWHTGFRVQVFVYKNRLRI